jgi:hypothetical protein
MSSLAYINNNNTYTSDSNKSNNITNFNLGNNTEEMIIYWFHKFWIIFILLHLIYLIFVLIRKKYLNKNKQKLVEIGPNGETELRKINEDCAICINPIKDEVQLICSHSFCAKCIVDYGLHTHNMENIGCPICRKKTKILVSNFERNEENKKYYDIILNYNHSLTDKFSTTLCFCFDFFRFGKYYLSNILNANDIRFNQHRKFISLILMLVIIYGIIIFSNEVDHLIELIEEIFYYICLIVVIIDYCYRKFRIRNNSEYQAYINNNIN